MPCLGCWVTALRVRETWADLRFSVEELASTVDGVEVGKSVKEVKHDSQGSGLITWVNHDAVYQEGKAMGGGKAGQGRREKATSSIVIVFSWRFLWHYQVEMWSRWLDELPGIQNSLCRNYKPRNHQHRDII